MQLYEKRKKFLKGEEELSKWASISACYMTEESEADEEEIRQHTPQWRSEGMYYCNPCIKLLNIQLADLNKLIKKIDRRITKFPCRGTIQPKKRVRSFPSESEPPNSFPDWAVKQGYRSISSATATCTLPETPSTSSVLDSTSDSSDIDY